MALKVLSGEKRETRRPLKEQPDHDCFCVRINPDVVALVPAGWTLADAILPEWSHGAPYKKGEWLWCREPLRERDGCAVYGADGERVLVDGEPIKWRWKRDSLPAMHMPREACRALIKVTSTRLDRLRSISGRGAQLEGFETVGDFLIEWDRIYKSYPSKLNPYAWRIRFALYGEKL
jgi:hypothetical protein